MLDRGPGISSRSEDGDPIGPSGDPGTLDEAGLMPATVAKASPAMHAIDSKMDARVSLPHHRWTAGRSYDR